MINSTAYDMEIVSEDHQRIARDGRWSRFADGIAFQRKSPPHGWQALGGDYEGQAHFLL